jgi:nucleotide-binding universal stress UspA family protein
MARAVHMEWAHAKERLMFPPTTILAGVDFSEPSRAALHMAARLAAQCNGELHVLYAEDPLICAAARAAHVRPCEETRTELAAFIAASALPPQVVIRPHVIEGRAADVICTIGRREQADVIVVGTHGRSAVNRLVFGSTADAVLRHSRMPVLLVPPAWTPPAGTHTDLRGCGPIVAGVDFTAGSFEAVAAAASLARLLRTPLQLVHVVAEATAAGALRHLEDDALARHAEAADRDLACVARGVPKEVAVERRIERGSVAHALAAVAQSVGGHPLLVLGRRLPRSHGDTPGAIAHRTALLSQVPTLMYMATRAGD